MSGSDDEMVLYTAPTPNGWKVSIALEELALGYQVEQVRFEEEQQKTPGFLAMNPNGRIPVLRHAGRVLAESGAILWYLAERHGALLPSGEDRYEALQWLMFQMSGLGPMMGQAMYFLRIAQPQGYRDDFALRRYQDESIRLLGILDERLATRDYLCGEYSIVDIACFPYAAAWPWAGLDIERLGNLRRWIDGVAARPAVRRGLAVPVYRPEVFGLSPDMEEASAANAALYAPPG